MPNITLTAEPDALKKALYNQDGAGLGLLQLPHGTDSEIELFIQRFFEWDDYNVALLESSFEASGWMTSTPVAEYRGVGIATLPLRLNRANVALSAEQLGAVESEIRAKQGVLRSIANRISVYPTQHQQAETPASVGDSQAIFIVHGHAHALREKVRRFLEKVTTRQVIVLEDEANQGNDILGKLLESADQAAYAVVLLTGDDEGRKIGEGEWKSRARQNVVLELGLFLGKLGRTKVAALYQSGVEIPSDFYGVVYIDADDTGWTMKLATELKAAGIEVDLNKAI